MYDTKTTKWQTVNRSKLHLSKKETVILRDNFVEAKSNIFQWHLIEGYDKSFSEVEESNSDSHKASFHNNVSVLRRKHFNKLIVAHSNINSSRNKFEFLVDVARDNDDILLYPKLNSMKKFQWANLKLKDLMHRNLITTGKLQIEGFYVELSLRRQKCLICCSFDPKKTFLSQHIDTLSKSIDLSSSS